jgi:hypothetical protein
MEEKRRVMSTCCRGSGLALTTIGGGSDDRAAAIAADVRGTVYVVGQTRSPDFRVVGGLQERLRGEIDAFVAELGPARLPRPRRTSH